MIDSKIALTYISTLKNYRMGYEVDWYKDYFAYENNCFVGWNRNTKSLVTVPYKKTFFNNLPEVKKQADSLENTLLTFIPKPVIYPENVNDQSQIEESRQLSRLCTLAYNDWNIANLFHEYIHLAIKYPVSFWEVSVKNIMNPDTGKFEKTVVPLISDAFDWLFDPRIPFESNPMIVKIVRKSMSEIKQYKEFKMPKIQGSNSISDFKEMINIAKFGVRREPREFKTFVCYQIFEKVADGIDMQIIDLGGNVLESKHYANFTRYPVIPLKLSSGSYYQNSYVHNLIGVNRSISLTANRIESFVLRWLKGGYLIREGSDVTFGDENATKVYFTGEPPTLLPTPQFQPAMIDWFRQLFTIAERYGMNQVSMGLTPRGSNMRTKGQGDQAISTQKQQQKTALDFMMEAVAEIFRVSMYYWSEFTDEPKNFTFKNDDAKFQNAQFIGEKYVNKLNDQQKQNTFVIPHNIKAMEIDIEDTSESSLKAKRKEILDLAGVWDKIPQGLQKVLTDLYLVGSTSDVMDDIVKQGSMMSNQEIQNMIELARAGKLPPEVQQALSTVFGYAAKQSPVPSPDKLAGGMKPAPGTAIPPQAPQNNQPPAQPAAPGGQPNAGK